MPDELKKKRPRAPKAAKGFSESGVKAKSAPAGWPFGTQAAAPAEPPAPPPADEPDEPKLTAETPLELLLAVVKSTGLKLTLRMQAAALAAPFVHAKPAPGGKKGAQADAAKGVASKFSATAPPLKLVNR